MLGYTLQNILQFSREIEHGKCFSLISWNKDTVLNLVDQFVVNFSVRYIIMFSIYSFYLGARVAQ